jgi:hypothetical protein
MEPTAGEMDQVTAVLVVPVTVAVNCCCWEAFRVAVAGDTETPTVGCKVITADADFVESAALVTVTVTLCWVVTVDGAV